MNTEAKAAENTRRLQIISDYKEKIQEYAKENGLECPESVLVALTTSASTVTNNFDADIAALFENLKMGLTAKKEGNPLDGDQGKVVTGEAKKSKTVTTKIDKAEVYSKLDESLKDAYMKKVVDTLSADARRTNSNETVLEKIIASKAPSGAYIPEGTEILMTQADFDALKLNDKRKYVVEGQEAIIDAIEAKFNAGQPFKIKRKETAPSPAGIKVQLPGSQNLEILTNASIAKWLRENTLGKIVNEAEGWAIGTKVSKKVKEVSAKQTSTIVSSPTFKGISDLWGTMNSNDRYEFTHELIEWTEENPTKGGKVPLEEATIKMYSVDAAGNKIPTSKGGGFKTRSFTCGAFYDKKPDFRLKEEFARAGFKSGVGAKEEIRKFSLEDQDRALMDLMAEYHLINGDKIQKELAEAAKTTAREAGVDLAGDLA